MTMTFEEINTVLNNQSSPSANIQNALFDFGSLVQSAGSYFNDDKLTTEGDDVLKIIATQLMSDNLLTVRMALNILPAFMRKDEEKASKVILQNYKLVEQLTALRDAKIEYPDRFASSVKGTARAILTAVSRKAKDMADIEIEIEAPKIVFPPPPPKSALASPSSLYSPNNPGKKKQIGFAPGLRMI